MAKIGIISIGIAGCVHSSCEIARRLGARGHQVVLASTDPRAAARLHNTPLAFHLLSDGVPLSLRDELERTPAGTARWRLRKLATKARGESALRGHGIDAFLEEEAPDLLLVESELHNTILYLQQRNTPMVLLEYHLSVRRRRGVPPLDSPLLPGATFATARSAVAWQRTLFARRRRQSRERSYLGPWDARSVWTRLARAAGTELNAIAVEDQWPLLFYPNLPRLNLCVPELDFSATAADAQYFVGPVMQRRRSETVGDREAATCRHWLEQRDHRRPLVVCATGSILTLPQFTKTVVAAARGADFDLLLAAGMRADASTLGQPLPNARVVRFIPQLEALAQASLFITHGGVASIHESLLAGVPMLVYSGGCMDENGNAARVEYHGLGIRGQMTHDEPDHLRAKIDGLLHDDRYAGRVRAMRDTLRRYETDQRLEQSVDAHLAALDPTTRR